MTYSETQWTSGTLSNTPWVNGSYTNTQYNNNVNLISACSNVYTACSLVLRADGRLPGVLYDLEPVQWSEI